VSLKQRSFLAMFLAIAIIGTITWLAIFEHNYHPRIYRYSEEVASSEPKVCFGNWAPVLWN